MGGKQMKLKDGAEITDFRHNKAEGGPVTSILKGEYLSQ